MIARPELEELLPHRGAMCLLDSVASWSPERITCRAVSHRDPRHPLAIDGSLPAIAGVEYAAQAMAVHGALVAGGDGRPRSGYLATVRDVVVSVVRLDTLSAPLDITAERLFAEDGRVIYGFAITCDGQATLSGRAAVVLDIAA